MFFMVYDTVLLTLWCLLLALCEPEFRMWVPMPDPPPLSGGLLSGGQPEVEEANQQVVRRALVSKSQNTVGGSHGRAMGAKEEKKLLLHPNEHLWVFLFLT